MLTKKFISMGMLALSTIMVLSACNTARPATIAVKIVPTATVVPKPTAAPTVAVPTQVPATKPAPTTAPTIKPTNAVTVSKTSPTSTAVTLVTRTLALSDVIGAATSAGKFKTLLSLLATAGMTDMLRKPGPWTVFAPTDDAFAKLPKDTLDALLKPANKKKLVDVLSLHFASGKDTVADLAKLKMLRMSNGATVTLSSKANVTSVNNAKVVQADITVANGVVNAIDSVLLPTK